jgi:hypothetical protein
MDEQGFDNVSRLVSSNASRRQVAATLMALTVSAIHVPRTRAAQNATPAPTCGEGQAVCAGACVDTCCDNSNCGACGNACAPGFTCFEGVCDCPSGLCCPEGEQICDGKCVSTCCDSNNCGACGNVCAEGFTCFEGICDCPSGLCGPQTPPNTGTGASSTGGGSMPWLAAALASGAAAAFSVWLGRERHTTSRH